MLSELKSHKYDRETLFPYNTIPPTDQHSSLSKEDQCGESRNRVNAFGCKQSDKATVESECILVLNDQEHCPPSMIHQRTNISEAKSMSQLGPSYLPEPLKTVPKTCEKVKIPECSVCGKFFETHSRLHVHKRVHSDLRLFPCNFCAKSFKFCSGLSRHLKRQHFGARQRYLSAVCGERQGSKNSPSSQDVIVQKMKRHDGAKVNEQEEGSFGSMEQHSLEIEEKDLAGKHTEFDANSDELNEVQCTSLYRNEDLPHATLSAHIQTCEKTNDLKCSEVEKVFESNSALLCHKHAPSVDRLFPYELCEKPFKFKRGLSRHAREQHYERQMQPSMTVNGRGQNEEDCTSETKHNFENKVCGSEETKLRDENFNQQQSYFAAEGNHSHGNTLSGQKHEKVKVYGCLECEKAFQNYSALVNHKHKHSDERLYPCTSCAKSFKFKSGVARHIREQHLYEGQTDQNLVEDERKPNGKSCTSPASVYFPKTRPCRFCKERFPKAEFSAHMRKCEKAKVHKCSHCEKAFRKLSVLLTHKRKHSDERSFPCQICTKSFKFTHGLARHMKEQHDRQKLSRGVVFVQTQRSKESLSQTKVYPQYEVHVGPIVKETRRYDSEEKKFTDEYCEQKQNDCEIGEESLDSKQKTIEFSSDELENVESNFEFPSRPCRYCNEHFPNAMLWAHMQKCEEAKVHKCSNCEKAFRKQSELQNHMRKYSDERSFPCNICPKTFKYRGGLARHMKKQHVKGQMKLSVNTVVDKRKRIESRASGAKVSLERGAHFGSIVEGTEPCDHESDFESEERNSDSKQDNFEFCDEKIPEAENNFELNSGTCRYCNEEFPNATLWAHAQICEKAKVHKCTDCEKSFRKPSTLRNHKSRHSDERLFHCSVCTKTFKYKSGLARHMKDHYGERQMDSSVKVDEREREGCSFQNSGPIVKESGKFDCEETDEEKFMQQQRYFEIEEKDLDSKQSDIETNFETTRQIEEKDLDSKQGDFEHNFEQSRRAAEHHGKDETNADGEEQGIKECSFQQEEVNFQQESNLEENDCYLGEERIKEDHYHFENKERNVGSEGEYSKVLQVRLEEDYRDLDIQERDSNDSQEEHFREGEDTFEIDSRTCRFCNEVFSIDMFWRHRLKCDMAKVHTCRYCEKTFRKRSEMLDHEHKHSDERLFPCRFCGKAFKFKSGLSRHTRGRHFKEVKENNTTNYSIPENVTSAKKETEYILQEIDQDENLQAQEALENYRNFKCPYCPKTFWTQSEMQEHLHKHSDIRSFPCDLCSKAFKFRSGLVRHVKKEHDITLQSLKRTEEYQKFSKFRRQMRGEQRSSESTYPCEADNELKPDIQSSEFFYTVDQKNIVPKEKDQIGTWLSSAFFEEQPPPCDSNQTNQKSVIPQGKGQISNHSVTWTSTIVQEYTGISSSDESMRRSDSSLHSSSRKRQEDDASKNGQPDADESLTEMSILGNDRSVFVRKKRAPAYSCNKCNDTFEDLCDFLTHQRIHKKTRTI